MVTALTIRIEFSASIQPILWNQRREYSNRFAAIGKVIIHEES